MLHAVSGRALRVLLVTGVLGLGASAPALADQVTISGTSDVTAQGIWSLASGTGGTPTTAVLTSNDNNGNDYRTLLKFDVAGNLPPGAVISDAHLILHTGNSSDNFSMSTLVFGEWAPWTSDATWDTPDGTATWEGGRFGTSGGTSPYGEQAEAVNGVVDYGVSSEVGAEGLLLLNPNYLGDQTTEAFVSVGQPNGPKLVVDYETS